MGHSRPNGEHIEMFAREGNAPGRSATTSELGYHRADSIVRDAELIERQLTRRGPWSMLRQSFGGGTNGPRRVPRRESAPNSLPAAPPRSDPDTALSDP
jgi:hypothetical protein